MNVTFILSNNNEKWDVFVWNYKHACQNGKTPLQKQSHIIFLLKSFVNSFTMRYEEAVSIL